MTPYFDDGQIAIYCGDCRDVLPTVAADVLVMDPPYGIAYRSDWIDALPGIVGDSDTTLRDLVLDWWTDARPALVFGSWKRPRPRACRAVLVWEKGDVGMGDLALPWKPNTEEIYVIGHGFTGTRGSSVLHHRAPLTWNSHKAGRQHPHEKPVALMRELIATCPPGVVLDPFMGGGSTLRAAKDLGRRAIGIEIDKRYCEIAAQRLAQHALNF